MCHKAVTRCVFIIQSKSECYKTHEMCYKAVTRWVFVSESITNQYKTEKNMLQSCFFISFFNSIFPWKYKV